ncbi:adenosine deaminase [Propioniciclava coleopterorum]|uniref:Adenosine deaminase n=1 Tax=Propioniciclava coleopterorum TaxID=2714937 RepID=A0A6G7Y578_9ACTN|nr:adenosine deaminase [Propioniciclava coleopterorum]QIK71777.1 adenosine deaminase [Propioniciclava coleopterorum]
MEWRTPPRAPPRPRRGSRRPAAGRGHAPTPDADRRRDLAVLPKAHLHLHFTGSLSVPTLIDLAAAREVELPEQLIDSIALEVPADKRGWFRFQRLYDVARSVVRGEDALRTVVARAAAEDAAEGSRRLELQVDPTSYAGSVGGLQPALEIVLDEARAASARTGVQVGIIVAGSRIRHPFDARTLARLAARYVGQGPGEVCGFGLSNNEWEGPTDEWDGAFRIARRAGLPGVPHAGELRGPEHVAEVVEALQPTRIGHGVRTVEDPFLLDRIVGAGIAFEVCPASNVQLGVYPTLADVPLRPLLAAGARVALGADDPLLFLSRLTDQYATARGVHGLSDDALAGLARSSIEASFAAETDKRRWLDEVDSWLLASTDERSDVGTAAGRR